MKRQFRHLRENELFLEAEDFVGGHLKDGSFIRLKEECWYIPYHDKVVIKVPADLSKNLTEDLGFYGVRALSKLRNDRQSAFFQAIALFLVGLGVLGALAFFWDYIYGIVFLTEFITIISWVFIWSGVSKWFIENRDLQDKRYTILQLLCAEVIPEQD